LNPDVIIFTIFCSAIILHYSSSQISGALMKLKNLGLVICSPTRNLYQRGYSIREWTLKST
jgi:hypothetical protein